MKRTWKRKSAVWILTLLLAAPVDAGGKKGGGGAAAGPDKKLAAEIEALVKNLSGSNETKYEAAEERLAAIGEPAFSALEPLLESPNEELRDRVKELLEKMEWFPPAKLGKVKELVHLLKTTRSADDGARAIIELRHMGRAGLKAGMELYPCRKLQESELEMEVRGRDQVAGLPVTKRINSVEIRECLAEPIQQIIEAVKLTLEKCPPELAADLVERGMVLAGGGALMKGLDRALMKETGLPVIIAPSPLLAVCLGTGKALEYLDKFKRRKAMI